MSKTITISVELELDDATVQKIAMRGFVDSKTGNHIGMGVIVSKCRRFVDHRAIVLSNIDDSIDFAYEFDSDSLGRIQTYLFPKNKGKGPAVKVFFDDGGWYYTIAPRVHYDRVAEMFDGVGASTPYKSQWPAIRDANDILLGKKGPTIQ